MKAIAYFVELCWVAAFFIGSYLTVMTLAPQLIPPEPRAVLLQMLFALGSGPLGVAVCFLGNALVPHSADHTMSLVIHLFPLLTAFSLRWHSSDPRFPINLDVGFLEYVVPSCSFVLVWLVGHTVFMLRIGMKLPDMWRTSYKDNMLANNGDNPCTRVLGKIGDGQNESLWLCKHNGISAMLSMLGLSCTYPLFVWGNIRVHFIICMGTCMVSVWNGANWYERNVSGFSRRIDKLLDEESTALMAGI